MQYNRRMTHAHCDPPSESPFHSKISGCKNVNPQKRKLVVSFEGELHHEQIRLLAVRNTFTCFVQMKVHATEKKVIVRFTTLIAAFDVCRRRVS